MAKELTVKNISGDNNGKILTVSRKSHTNTPLRPSWYLEGASKGFIGRFPPPTPPHPTIHANETFWPVCPQIKIWRGQNLHLSRLKNVPNASDSNNLWSIYSVSCIRWQKITVRTFLLSAIYHWSKTSYTSRGSQWG